EGGLGDMNSLRRLPEMERFGERHKVVEAVQFHHDKFNLLKPFQIVLDVMNILLYIDIVNKINASGYSCGLALPPQTRPGSVTVFSTFFDLSERVIHSRRWNENSRCVNKPGTTGLSVSG